MSVETDSEPRHRRLLWANLALLTVVWLHDLDHVRQVREVEGPVGAIGLLGMAATILSLALTMSGSRFAAPYAALVGFGTALGFVAVHLVPDWGPLSDGYPDIPVDTTSWIAAIVPIPFALWLGISALRARSEASPAS